MTAPDDFKYYRLSDDPDESHQLVLNMIPRQSLVLEVGAALGYMSKAIEARGSTVVAVEPDPAAAAVAQSLGVDVRLGSLEDVRLDQFFDCLVLADVLEHVADPHRFLAVATSHLRPGATVVLSVPNVAHWSLRWAHARGRFDYQRTGLMDDTHLRFYTNRSLAELLGRHGLTIVERRASIGLGVYPRWRSAELQWRQRQFLRLLARWRPELFGFQFIWRAQLG